MQPPCSPPTYIVLTDEALSVVAQKKLKSKETKEVGTLGPARRRTATGKGTGTEGGPQDAARYITHIL
jgi:hypothetical protein